MCISPAVQIYKNITFLSLHTSNDALFCGKKKRAEETSVATSNEKYKKNIKKKYKKPNPTKLHTMDKPFHGLK